MTDRPNIILVITDQQRFDTIGALGAPWMYCLTSAPLGHIEVFS